MMLRGGEGGPTLSDIMTLIFPKNSLDMPPNTCTILLGQRERDGNKDISPKKIQDIK